MSKWHNYDNETELEIGMSNFDHTIDSGLDKMLKAGGVYAQHAAWNFCGYVRWNGEQFVEEVWIHGSPQATVMATTLEELMSTVNDEYGWE